MLSKQDVLESVDAALRTFLTKPWSTASSGELRLQGDSVGSKVHKLAKTISFETQLRGRQELLLANKKFRLGAGVISPGVRPETGPPAGWNPSHPSVQVSDAILTLPATRSISQSVGALSNVEVYAGDYVIEILGLTGASMTSVSGLNIRLEYPSAGPAFVDVVVFAPGSNTVAFTLPADLNLSSFTLKLTNVHSSSITLSSVSVYRAEIGLTPAQEAVRRGNIHGLQLERYQCSVKEYVGSAILCGDKVTLRKDRFDLADGKDFIVIGREDDTNDETITLDILG